MRQNKRVPGCLGNLFRETGTSVSLVVTLLALSFSAGAQEPHADPRDLVINAAVEQIGLTIHYDPSYRAIPYPGGDIPPERGVCSDVLIRAFRAARVDLQVLVHEDMARSFQAYPNIWGLARPDPNIDHRRVLNLMRFFERQATILAPSPEAADYLPADVVAWRLASGSYHIGLVTGFKPPDAKRPLIVHNIGAGTMLEDILFSFEIIGHYRYF